MPQTASGNAPLDAAPAPIRLRFTLERWCLWQSGALLHGNGWPCGWMLSDEAAGSLDFLPMMQRRRLSPLARAAMAVAWDCRGEHRDLPAVFCSRHGESRYYFDMLNELAQHRELSPSRFSLSVHNAIAGLYSLCSETRSACVALAGGKEDCYGAFLEAAGLLADGADRRILLVCYDQALPELYRAYVDGPDQILALGMRLSVASLPGPKIELTRTVGAASAPTGCELQRLCRAIVRGERQSAENGDHGAWAWALTDG